MVYEQASVGQTMRNMAREAETEFARLIANVNDAVVPEVRRSSSLGLRAAAEQLGRLAEHLDQGTRGRAFTNQGAHAEAAGASAQASAR